MEKAAISLAVSVVSPIFTKLGEKAESYLGGDITDDDVQNLKNKILPTFQNLLEMADQIPVRTLTPWLMTLQEACYEVEDVFDMCEYKRLKDEVSSKPNYIQKLKEKVKEIAAPIIPKTELKKSMEKLQKSYDDAKELTRLYGVNIEAKATLAKETSKEEAQRQTVASMSSPVFGRDKERDLLINKLISVVEQPNNTERKVPVHAIYGLGGAGKTTLAQFVYNDPRIAEHFEQRIWVHISRKFEVSMITTKIIEGIKKCGFPQINNLDVLQTNLKDLLRSSEKFLIILDDVWCDKKAEWNQMLIPFNEVGYSNCRIVITARAEEVVKTLDVKHPFPIPELETSEFLSVFNYYSFGDAVTDTDKDFSEIAKKIVEKLHKSPLAAMVVGSLLKQNPSISFWNYILNQDMLKETRNTLYLSFQQLPLHLRRCFAFCSLYPKGYNFKMYEIVNHLVLYWISQGFVEEPKSNELITLEEKGMQYFNELVSYSFFQKNKLGDVDYYVVHDLLHDLTEKVSEEYYLRIENEEPITIPKTIMHLSIFLQHQHSISSISSQNI